MYSLLRHIRLVVIACTALALSAGLAFGATPPAASTGLANAAAHAGKTVPVAGGQQTLGEGDETAEDQDATESETADETDAVDTDEVDTDETDTDEVEDAEDATDAESCTVDPTAATPEELDAMNHGAVVCWAAQQTEWPTWFSNHGAFVRCWAHQGKTDAVPCTEDPAAVQGAEEETTGDQVPASHGKSHGHGKAKGKLKHQG